MLKHKCELCNKEFANKSNYNAHKKKKKTL